MKKWMIKIRHKLNGLSFFQKIVCTSFFIIMVPMVIFEIYSAKTMERIVVEQVMAETRDSVYLASSNIENLLSKIVSVQLFLYEDEELTEIAEAVSKLSLDDLCGQEQKLLNIKFSNRVDKIQNSMLFNTVVMRSNAMMVSSHGVMLANYKVDEKKAVSLIAEYRKTNQANLKTIGWMGISENIEDSYDNQDAHMITLLKNMDLTVQNGNQVNLLISIMEKPLSEMLAGRELKNNRFLVDATGTIISSNNKSVLNKELSSMFEEIPMEKGYDTVMISNDRIGEVLVSYSKLKISPWVVVDVKPYSQIADKISENGKKLLVVNLLFVAAFLVIAGLIANSITKPLTALADTMANTELSKPVNEIKKAEVGGKEIVQIYRCYEIMRIEILHLFKKNEEVQKRKRETELMALQAQVKPHFLFNTLMSIRCAIVNGHGDKAADMTLALSNLLRMSIVKIDEVITLSQEIENLQTYVLIQNMRSRQKVNLLVNISSELEQYPVPKLLFQPLIENAIAHGFEHMEQGTIALEAVILGNQVRFTVKDDGVGFEKNPLDSVETASLFSGFGVGNVEERIKLYYGKEYGLQYENDGGTIITLYLPIKWGDEYHV